MSVRRKMKQDGWWTLHVGLWVSDTGVDRPESREKAKCVNAWEGVCGLRPDPTKHPPAIAIGPELAMWPKPGQSGIFYLKPKRGALSFGLWRSYQNSSFPHAGKSPSVVQENGARKSVLDAVTHEARPARPQQTWGCIPQIPSQGRISFSLVQLCLGGTSSYQLH